MIGDIDRKYWNKGFIVIGVDEVGKGALAGPVSAGAVMMAADPGIAGINDSKKLEAEKREKIGKLIREKCFYSIASEDEKVIDTIGIAKATFSAMRKAVYVLMRGMEDKLSRKEIIVLVDGREEIPELNFNQRAIIRGDGLSLAIAAASIVAKVSRDTFMKEIGWTKYPEYGFERHKGYGTSRHLMAIEELGLCPIHRRSVKTASRLYLHNDWLQAKKEKAPWYELQRLGRYEEDAKETETDMEKG